MKWDARPNAWLDVGGQAAVAPRDWVPAGVGVISVLGGLALFVPIWAIPVLAALAIWFTTPGFVLVGRAFGWRAASLAWLLAPCWGFGLSLLGLLAAWACGARSAGALALAPVAGSAIAWGGGVLVGRLRPVPLTRADAVWLPITMLLVPLLVCWPYSRVGEIGPDGAAIRAYFTADFVWALASVAEIAKGAFLPANPFLAGERLHYYWLAHLFPAAEYQWLGSQLTLIQILLGNAVLSGTAFVAFLYALARHFTRRAWAAAVGVAVAVLATSFEGLEQLLRLWWWQQPLDLVRYINIDAVSRWYYHGMPVDGLQRLLLYQPHHQLGYALAFSGLIVARQARRPCDWRVTVFVGASLGVGLLVSTFSAFMLTVAVAMYLGARVLRARAWRAAPLAAVAAGLPLAGAVGLSELLKYVDHTGSVIRFGVNRVATTNVLAVWGLSFGPLLLALVVLLGVGVKRRRVLNRMAAIWALAAVCVVFYFVVDVRDHQDVYVGWRAGHLLFIAFAAIAARLADAIAALGRSARYACSVLALLVVAAALPTTLIDLYNTQDISNFGEAPGFRWTLLLRHDELDAFAWIRSETSPDAVVQIDPVARGAETWAYIPAFAERRMAAGLPISMIPTAKYERASQRVVRIFRATDPEVAEYEALSHGVDYVFVGPPERQAHPTIESVLDAAGWRFTSVFRNGTVSLFRVNRSFGR